jgi:penicillin-binding protein 1A
MRQLKASKSRLEAGFVAMDPATGEVKAWVGSRDFEREQYDHVAQAARQPGSTFKPIVYAAALEKGIAPEHAYLDAVTTIRFADGSVWRPTDNSGTTGPPADHARRPGPLEEHDHGAGDARRRRGARRQAGAGPRCPHEQAGAVPSIALGTSPVTLLEMVSAYSTIAAQGEYRKPVFVRRITDRDGKVIADFAQQARSACCRRRRRDPDRHDARRDQPRHRHRPSATASASRRRRRQDRHHPEQRRRLVHHDAPEPGGGRLGRLQRQPRDDALELLGAGRPQRDPAGGRLLQVGARHRQDQRRRAVPGRAKPEPVPRHEEPPPEEDMEEGGDMQQEGGPPADTPQPPENESPAPPQPELQQEGITLPPPNDA